MSLQLWESWDVAIELMLCQLVAKLGIPTEPPPPPPDGVHMPQGPPGAGATVTGDNLSVNHPSIKPRVVPVLGGSLRADTEGRGIVQGLPGATEAAQAQVGWRVWGVIL